MTLKLPSSNSTPVQLPYKREGCHPTKNKWFILKPLKEVGTPFKRPYNFSCDNIVLNTSTHKINRHGESRSPCLIPLEGFMRLIEELFTIIEYESVVTHVVPITT
jgi:hypothetical protein